MKTQLDNLKRQLNETRINIRYVISKGYEDSDMHKYLVEQEENIVSYINNIQ